MINIYNGDCVEAMKELENNSVDLVVTDCPYKIVQGGRTNTKKCGGGIFSHDNVNAKKGTLFDDNEIEFSEWLPDLYRVLKPGTHAYIMINGRNLMSLQLEAEKVGFEFQNLLVWKKDNVTPNRYYMQCLEFILLLRKGPARSINNMGDSNFFNIPNIKNKNHPTEKPVELMWAFIKNSSNQDDVVLDPFMGTGATGVACGNTRSFIGIEINKEYFAIAKQRINGGVIE